MEPAVQNGHGEGEVADAGKLRDLLMLLDQPLAEATLDDGLHRLQSAIASMKRGVWPGA